VAAPTNAPTVRRRQLLLDEPAQSSSHDRFRSVRRASTSPGCNRVVAKSRWPGSRPSRIYDVLPPLGIRVRLGGRQSSVRCRLGCGILDMAAIGPPRTGDHARAQRKRLLPSISPTNPSRWCPQQSRRFGGVCVSDEVHDLGLVEGELLEVTCGGIPRSDWDRHRGSSPIFRAQLCPLLCMALLEYPSIAAKWVTITVAPLPKSEVLSIGGPLLLRWLARRPESTARTEGAFKRCKSCPRQYMPVFWSLNVTQGGGGRVSDAFGAPLRECPHRAGHHRKPRQLEIAAGFSHLAFLAATGTSWLNHRMYRPRFEATG